MIKAAIIGGTGYTGVELLRILIQHPEVEITAVSSRADKGSRVDALFPSLRGHCDLTFCDPAALDYSLFDLVFFATPHGVAQSTVPEVLEAGVRVIDLSADFRIKDIDLWEQWYGQKHLCPDLVDQAVYGLPEMNRKQIAEARLIACPGCYPTSIQIGLKPILESDIDINLDSLVANAASGVTGAGRQAKLDLIYPEVADSYKAYALQGHRHLPEIEQGLSAMAKQPVQLTFVPHLLPVNRGILSTIYVDLLSDVSVSDLQTLYESDYQSEPFVDLLPAGQSPTLRAVRGTNCCQVGLAKPQGRAKVVVTVAEDNLTKGAAGQAVQNMNIMFGYNETLGLNMPALLP